MTSPLPLSLLFLPLLFLIVINSIANLNFSVKTVSLVLIVIDTAIICVIRKADNFFLSPSVVLKLLSGGKRNFYTNLNCNLEQKPARNAKQ